mgnify:CR=1 FL=1
MRIKSQWFQTGTAKTPQQTASAMAFITWRVAQNMLKQMRAADFSIEVGPQYFAFTREVLVFLTQVLDRMAYRVNDSMHDMAKQGKDAAYAAEHRLEREARHMRTNAQHYIQHEPMKSVLIAAGTGAATALLVSWIMRSRQY